MINYNLSFTGLEDVLADYKGENITLGLMRAFPKIGNGVKDLSIKMIGNPSGQYNIKQADIKPLFSVQANAEQVIISCTGRGINLTKFGAVQYGSVRGKRLTVKRSKDSITKSVRGKAGSFGGVKVLIDRDYTTLLHGAFIAKVKAGSGFNIGVFRRTGYAAKTPYNDTRNRRKTNRPYVKTNRASVLKPREAIRNMAMISVATIFDDAKGKLGILPAIQNYIDTTGKGIIIHELDFSLGRK